MLPQQYCLRWKYHHSNLQTMFSQLLDRGCFCDVTLACEGQLLRAHRVVLCACSSFFDTLLTNYSSERDPIVIMKDVAFDDVKCLIEFMYKGEINVEHSNLASLLKTADDLKIKGLAEVSWRDDEDPVAAAAAGSAIDYQQMRAYDMYTNGEQAANSHALHQQQQQQQQHHHQSLGAHTHAQAATHHGRHLHQPPSQQQHPHAHQQPHHGTTNRRRSPPMGDEEVRSPSDEAADLRKHHTSTGYRRLPHVAPHSISIAPVLTAPPDGYLGPKRKRGRPPMDDSYDVFNIHKLAQYSSVTQADTAPQPADSHAGHAIDERRLHPSAVSHASPPSSSTAAAAAAAAAIAYQQHVEHQAKQLSLRLRQSATNAEAEQQLSPRDPADDAQTDPEWINSNLEVNVAECETPIEDLLPENATKDTDSPRGHREDSLDVKDVPKQEQEGVAGGEQSKKERPSPPAPGTAEQEDGDDDEAAIASGPVPQSVEDIENMHHVLEHQATSAGDEQQQGGKSAASSASGGTSPAPASVASTSAAGGVSQHKSSGAALPPPSPLMTAAAAAHFGKYMASSEGYLLNEHGMLMTHDFIHAPTVNIPTSSAALANAAAAAAVAAAAASNGHVNGGGGGGGGGDHDFTDIKMEDYDAAELRLTSEEMTQWQDVIKMDDYLAKGRRPQFWEEPFTRRVLDAIKNKRLEMKKAARILGVSYGTLYGRYREVYGCLKHPYSSTTFRASQSSQLAAQPRFDMVWPSPKRDAALLAAGQLEVGKIRPKDLSELWTRPQI